MKILVVEDEKRIAAYIKKGLEQQHHTIDLAYTGLDGLDMACSVHYDVLVLDWMLPEMDGLTVCKNLRKEAVSTPILMLTAKGEVQDKVSGLESGADDYLTKPFAFSELIARINALSRRPKQTISEILSCDDLTLNTQDYRVKRGHTAINLTKKEAAVLEFMLRNQGQVLSTEQITEHVTTYNSDVLPNTTQVYIGYLRNKLDKPFPNKKPLITTVRGFGYRLGETND